MSVTDLIREAIVHEQYGEALRLWTSYAAALRREIEDRSISPDRMTELRELFTWSRSAMLCAREHLRDRYHAAEVAAVYRGHPLGGR